MDRVPDWCDWPPTGTPLSREDVEALRHPHGLTYVGLHTPEGRTNVLIMRDGLSWLAGWNRYAGDTLTDTPTVRFDDLASLVADTLTAGCTVWGIWHMRPDGRAESHRHYYPVKP